MKLRVYFMVIAAMAGAVSASGLDRDECRELALKHSEAMRRAEISVGNAELERKIARTQYLPKIEGSATGVYMLPDMDMGGMKMQIHGAYMAGIQLTQPIYAGGKITAGNRLARLGREAAGEQLRMTRSDVIAQADKSYWTYVSVRSKVEMVEQFVSMIDTLLQQTGAAVEAGMATESDLLRVKAKQSEMDYQLRKARNGADLCRMALCNVIGFDMDSPLEVSDTVPDCQPAGRTFSTDISRRPEVRLLQLGVDVKRQQARLALGDFLPTVGVSLGYNYYGNFKMKGMADVGGGVYVPYTQEYRDGMGVGLLSVSIPLFHWGEGAMKVRKARREVESARLEEAENTRLMTLEARQAAIQLEDGGRLVDAAEVALEQARESLRVEQNRFEVAMGSLTELLDAQTQWYQARSNLIEARTQFQISLTDYLRAVGEL